MHFLGPLPTALVFSDLETSLDQRYTKFGTNPLLSNKIHSKWLLHWLQKSAFKKLHLLPLMMTLELQDILFFVRSLKQSALSFSSSHSFITLTAATQVHTTSAVLAASVHYCLSPLLFEPFPISHCNSIVICLKR